MCEFAVIQFGPKKTMTAKNADFAVTSLRDKLIYPSFGEIKDHPQKQLYLLRSCEVIPMRRRKAVYFFAQIDPIGRHDPLASKVMP